MNQPEVLKQAFVLGLYRAAKEVGIEKTAGFWDAAARIPFVGKAAPAVRFGLFGTGPLSNKFSPTAQKYIRDTLIGGSLSGGMNLAMGDKETPWTQRLGEGWLGGAASGLAFRAGIHGARSGLSRLGQSQWLGNRAPNLAQRLTQATDLSNPGHSTIGGIWRHATSGHAGSVGEAGKRLGMYTLAGAPIAAGGFWLSGKGEGAASGLMNSGTPIPPQMSGVPAPSIQSPYHPTSPFNKMYRY